MFNYNKSTKAVLIGLALTCSGCGVSIDTGTEDGTETEILDCITVDGQEYCTTDIPAGDSGTDDTVIDNGSTDNSGSTDNGSTDNGSTGNGSTGNGSTDNGSTDNGSTDNGSTGNGSTDNGSTDNGSTDNGSTDNGSTDNGSTDNGSTDNGSTDNGSTDNGSTGNGSTVNTGTGVADTPDSGDSTFDSSLITTGNPFQGTNYYLNPDYSTLIDTSIAQVSNNTALVEKMETLKAQSTAVWLDRIDAIYGGDVNGGRLSLEEHLIEAVAQQKAAANGGAIDPMLISIIVYNLPNRDCAALASNGTLSTEENGLNIYKSDYIDVIYNILSDSRFKDLRLALTIEPDSLPNLITNVSGEQRLDACVAAKDSGVYVDGIQYALNKLSQLDNTYNYLDIAHSGWLGWADNMEATAELMAEVVRGATSTGDMSVLNGFITNVANYTPTEEPFLTNPSVDIRSTSFYEWNPAFDEKDYVDLLAQSFVGKGFDSDLGFIIDTSRNGWGGDERPTSLSSGSYEQIVSESRVDRRIHRGNWCNQEGAGIGELPQANPYGKNSAVQAFVWVKPPGESDGSSDASENTANEEGKQSDPMCQPSFSRIEGGVENRADKYSGALDNAPHAGHWFHDQFVMLIDNAYPAITGTATSNTPVTSTPVVSTPVTSTPVVSTPVTTTPVVSTPVTSTPVTGVVDTPDSGDAVFDSALITRNNPFQGTNYYLNPDYANLIDASIDQVNDSTLAQQMENMKTYSTAVWLDRIDAIYGGDVNGGRLSLEEHLVEAVRQQTEAANGGEINPMLINIIVYNLPDRDCAALASNGTLSMDNNGLEIYKNQYIDVIYDLLSDSRFQYLRLALTIEPDSLPNLVTNVSGAGQREACVAAAESGAYVDGVQYALGKLGQLDNTYSYLDIAHSGWLGWTDNMEQTVALMTEVVKGAADGDMTILNGFISNVANYTPTEEPYLTNPEYNLIHSSDFYEWNAIFDEKDYVEALAASFRGQGFRQDLGFVIDTSRNGWGDENRPTSGTTFGGIESIVNNSRIDGREHRGNWCNQEGAGIGERPQANPYGTSSSIQAFVWIKPPGESDGSSDASENVANEEGKRSDPMCQAEFTRTENAGTTGSGATANAPHAGHWFHSQFVSLIQNAFPSISSK